MNQHISTASIAIALALVQALQASEETNGPKGINSIATGLDGAGVPIGQVEGGRPGRAGNPNNDTSQINQHVVPAASGARDRLPNPNEGVDDHALWVASVMISQQMATQNPMQSPPVGVAQQASLFSSAFIVDPVGILQEDAAIAAQSIANFGVWATNMSFGLPHDGVPLDGTSTLTSFVDWSTWWHEVLYVVSGTEVAPAGPVPTDNFNGITVAASARADDGVFREVAIFNVYDDNVDAVG